MLKVEIVESLLVGISLTNICVSVLISTSYGENCGCGYCGNGAWCGGITAALNNSCGAHGLKPKLSKEYCESIEPPLVRAMPSENVSDVSVEWQRLGGEFVLSGIPCCAFSVSFVRLMIFLMCSF